MSEDRHNPPNALRDRMLAAYGADIKRWPQGRLSGLWGYVSSAEFRAARAREGALDQAIAAAAPSLADGDRLERRLLARMGFIESGIALSGGGINPVWATTMAVACICFGVALGGVYGGDAATEFAVLAPDGEVWDEIAQENLFEDFG